MKEKGLFGVLLFLYLMLANNNQMIIHELEEKGYKDDFSKKETGNSKTRV